MDGTQEAPLDTAAPDWARVTPEQLAYAHVAVYARVVHGLTPARHHKVWLQTLQDMADHPDDPDKVLIIAPPGHAKSTYVSQVFPPWWLGRFPHQSILHFTSTDPLAGLFHARVRDTFELEPKHAAVFPDEACRPGIPWNFEMGLRLKGAADKVSYRMAGYGASSIGLRANITILDDPLDQKKAQSETEQQAAKDYFDQTLFTRRQPNAKFIAIMTRWHWNDLAQHLIDKWGFRVIHMPALGYWDGLDMGGAALWPEYWSRAAILENLGDGEHEGMGIAQFTMVYQGYPTRPEGNMLNPDLAKQIPDLEAKDGYGTPFVRITDTVQSWDLAFAKRTRSDYSVCATGATDGANVYLLDLLRARLSEHEFEQALHLRASIHHPSVIGIEAVAAAEWVVQGLEGRTNLPIRAVKVGIQSKEARAELFALKLQQGRFFVDKTAPWWRQLAQEMVQFPHGQHDDMVDAIAQACHLLVKQRYSIQSYQALDLGRGEKSVQHAGGLHHFSAAKRAVAAVHQGQQVGCSVVEYKREVRRALLDYRARCLASEEIGMVRFIDAELQRLDEQFRTEEVA